MARDDPYFRLRVPESLRQRVESAATANKRSMTAEILQRLEDSFLFDVDFPEWEGRFAKMEDAIREMKEMRADHALVLALREELRTSGVIDRLVDGKKEEALSPARAKRAKPASKEAED